MTTLKSSLQQCPFLFFLEKRLFTNFFEMLVRAKKYAQVEEGHDAHLHQFIPPRAVMPGTHALIAIPIEPTPTLLSASSSALTLEKQFSDLKSLLRKGDRGRGHRRSHSPHHRRPSSRMMLSKPPRASEHSTTQEVKLLHFEYRKD